MFDDLYQEILLDHYKNPRNQQDLSKTNAPLLENPVCGDSVRVSLEWSDDRKVHKVIIDSHGCAISTASASMMTEILQGKSSEEAQEICSHFLAVMRKDSPNDLDQWGEAEALSGVIQYPARVKCATLPWHALQQALTAQPVS